MGTFCWCLFDGVPKYDGGKFVKKHNLLMYDIHMVTRKSFVPMSTQHFTSSYPLHYYSCIPINIQAPLRKRPNFVRHEKKWMRRKRLKMERRYLRLQEGVYELKAYIKFKQDNKPDY